MQESRFSSSLKFISVSAHSKISTSCSSAITRMMWLMTHRCAGLGRCLLLLWLLLCLDSSHIETLQYTHSFLASRTS